MIGTATRTGFATGNQGSKSTSGTQSKEVHTCIKDARATPVAAQTPEVAEVAEVAANMT